MGEKQACCCKVQSLAQNPSQDNWEMFLDRESCVEKLASEHTTHKQKDLSKVAAEV